jgi:hypothetical protein
MKKNHYWKVANGQRKMKSTNEAKNTTTKAYLKHSQNETKTLQQNILRMVKTYA